MSIHALYSSNAIFRVTLKTAIFALASLAAIFFASTGYGLLRMLLSGVSSGASGGILELSTHGGLTVGCFALAATGVVVAKKCLA